MLDIIIYYKILYILLDIFIYAMDKRDLLHFSFHILTNNEKKNYFQIISQLFYKDKYFIPI